MPVLKQAAVANVVITPQLREKRAIFKWRRLVHPLKQTWIMDNYTAIILAEYLFRTEIEMCPNRPFLGPFQHFLSTVWEIFIMLIAMTSFGHFPWRRHFIEPNVWQPRQVTDNSFTGNRVIDKKAKVGLQRSAQSHIECLLNIHSSRPIVQD